mmetsp:Transcript_19411/g.66513  ORF Transcript_19411/g.66513 Transcript_19411/m.66513 type:complete len:296 (-) Transcript_19411:1564-2451(-)
MRAHRRRHPGHRRGRVPAGLTGRRVQLLLQRRLGRLRRPRAGLRLAALPRGAVARWRAPRHHPRSRPRMPRRPRARARAEHAWRALLHRAHALGRRPPRLRGPRPTARRQQAVGGEAGLPLTFCGAQLIDRCFVRRWPRRPRRVGSRAGGRRGVLRLVADMRLDPRLRDRLVGGVCREAELVGPRAVRGIGPPLVQKDEEDGVVAERHDAVLQRHFHDEGKDVVDERVEDFVEEDLHRQVRDALEPVVDVELGQHDDEAKEVEDVRQRRDKPRIPPAVRVIPKQPIESQRPPSRD